MRDLRRPLQHALLFLVPLLASGWVLVTSIDGAAERAARATGQAAEEALGRAVAAEREAQGALRLGLLGDAVASDLTGRMDALVASVHRLAANPLVGGWVAEAAGRSDGAVLALATRPDDATSYLAVVDAQGSVLAVNGEVYTGPLTEEVLRSGLRMALGGASWGGFASLASNPRREGPSQHWMWIEPLKGPGGATTGAVVGGIDLAEAEGWLERWQKGAGDGASISLLLGDDELARAGVEEPGAASVTRAVGGGGPLKVKVTLPRPQVAPAPPGDADLADLKLRGLLGLLIVALTAVLTTWLLGRPEQQRLRALVFRAREISLGKVELPVGGLDQGDETGELARAVERLRISVLELMRRHPRRNPWR